MVDGPPSMCVCVFDPILFMLFGSIFGFCLFVCLFVSQLVFFYNAVYEKDKLLFFFLGWFVE